MRKYYNGTAHFKFADRIEKILDVEVKVELKCGGLAGHVSFLIHEREAQLNYLEQINVAFQVLILIIGRFYIATNLGYNARKFSVLFE